MSKNTGGGHRIGATGKPAERILLDRPMTSDETTVTRPEPVLIEWYDAASVTDGWKDRAEAIADGWRYSGRPILACGFLLSEQTNLSGTNVVVIALAHNTHNDDVSHVMSIPTVAIKSITRLTKEPIR